MLRILVLCLTLTPLLPIAMRAINAHEALAFRFQHVQRSVLVPTIDEIAMVAVPVANLSGNYHRLSSWDENKVNCGLTSPQANLKGGTPFQPPGIAFLVSYLVENLRAGIRFIPLGQRPPFAAEYAYFVTSPGLTQSGNRSIACMCAAQVLLGNAALGLLLRSSAPVSHHHVSMVIFSSMSDCDFADALPAMAWKSRGKGISALSMFS